MEEPKAYITQRQFLIYVSLFTLLYYLYSIIRTKYRPGLRHLPSPRLASISNIPRLWTCYKGHQMLHHLSLHEKYGPYVRLGPNHVSFSDSNLIPQTYSASTKFQKSQFYSMFDIKTPDGPMPTIFSVRDEDVHKKFKRPVAGAYAMSALRELEPMNDECTGIFLEKMGRVADAAEREEGDGVVDLGVWVHWYAWDTISSITFSNRLGFMEQEKDINDIISAINGRLFYNSIIGQAPDLHRFLFGNSIVARLGSYVPSVARLNSSKYIVDFTAQQLQRYHNNKAHPTGESENKHKDMLARFKRSGPSTGEATMSDSELLSHTSGNIFAGSDTTAASMRSLFHNLCRTRSAYKRLQAEIDAADQEGRLSRPYSTFAESLTLPFLQAVIKEALRMHPAVGLLLERIVPAGGLTLPNTTTSSGAPITIPAGTIIGINPWVAARDPVIYAPDPYTFRPERWLESSEEQLKLMERNFLAFGAGSRTCLGRHVSLLEMGKLVPAFLRKFDLELVGGCRERELEMRDYWFVQQKGLVVKVRRRVGRSLG